jgi:hypothetical protein
VTKRIALLSVFLVGCLPIPWKKTFVTWPSRTIRVVDEHGDPVPDAKVRVVREKYPHRRDDETRVLTANAKGEVKTERETTVLTVFPLMMHGVPGFGFRAAAESKGTACTMKSWSDPDDPTVLELKLRPGSLPCDAEPSQEVPANGTARIESITQDEDGNFVVVLAMPKGDSAKGAELAKAGKEPLKVIKVLWESDPTTPIRRARVHVSGDPLAYAYGDVLERQ